MTFPSVVKTVLVGTESTWGTPVSATKDVGLVQEISESIDREVIESFGLGSIQAQQINTGIVEPKLNITAEFQHGKLLEYIFGAVGHSTTGSDTVHTFTVSNTPPSATIESGNNLTSDVVLTYNGMLAESGEVSIALNENVKISADFTGKSVTSSTSAAAAVISSLPVFPHAMVAVTINSVAATECQKASIKLTKKVVKSGGISSNLYQQGHAVEIHAEFSATLGFTSTAYQQLMLGGTTPSATGNPTSWPVVLSATNGVTLGSGLRAFSIGMTGNQGVSFKEVASIGNLIFVDVTSKGLIGTVTSTDNIAAGSW